MDAATLMARVYKGLGKAASRIGYTVDQYRPSSATNPLASGNKLRSLPASFNAEDMTYGRPNKYGKPTWYGVFDGTLTQVGDYLKSTQDGTFFIAAQQTALPMLLVECNRVATFLRPQQQAGVGALGYGGNTDATETALMTSWPCSILYQAKGGSRGAVNLPGDVSDPLWNILLPSFGGVVLRAGDIVKDDLSRRYVVGSAELTDLGWRITAFQAQT